MQPHPSPPPRPVQHIGPRVPSPQPGPHAAAHRRRQSRHLIPAATAAAASAAQAHAACLSGQPHAERLHTRLPLAVCACQCHSVSVAPPRQLIHGYVKPQPPRITPRRIAVASPRPCGAAPHAALRSPRHTHHGTWAAAGPEAWTEASIRALNAPSSRRPPPSPPTASSATPGPMPTKTTPTTRVSPPPPDQASRPSVLGYRLTSAGAAQVHPPGPCRPLPPPSRARPVGPGPEKAEVSCGRAGAADGA